MKKVLSLVVTLLLLIVANAQENSNKQNYPQRAEDISPLLIGEKIDDLSLMNVQGERVKLKDLFSKKPTILVFYRGGWCPYCNLQLSGLQEIESDLNGMGYQVVAVSTDKPENLQSSMDKTKLSYQLFSDADLTLAKAMGIAFKAPQAYHQFLPESTGGKNKDMLLPVPSVFILNKSGEIRFEYIEPNFKERIAPELLIGVAKILIDSL